MSRQAPFTPPPGEIYCGETKMLVEPRRQRPGYDCRCDGCQRWVHENGDPMKRTT